MLEQGSSDLTKFNDNDLGAYERYIYILSCNI